MPKLLVTVTEILPAAGICKRPSGLSSVSVILFGEGEVGSFNHTVLPSPTMTVHSIEYSLPTAVGRPPGGGIILAILLIRSQFQ